MNANLFIRNDQYNFIKEQTRILVSGHATVSDKGVLDALKYVSMEKVYDLFEHLDDYQRECLNPLVNIKESAQAEAFLLDLKAYVIPFNTLTEQSIKKLFPKVKKLKFPNLETIDYKDTSYVSWVDSSHKKYLIVEHQNKLIGLQGAFTHSRKKGICMFCNRFEDVGMFTTATKGSSQDSFIKRGNYICQDSSICNKNIKTLDKIQDFVSHLNK